MQMSQTDYSLAAKEGTETLINRQHMMPTNGIYQQLICPIWPRRTRNGDTHARQSTPNEAFK